MAVGDEASLRPTDALLLQDGRKHYRTQVSPIHWQLRSLLSADRDGAVYFPAGLHNTHITRLNTKTNEFETVKVIDFHPRCLVAGGGYICCGGESGEFAIIRETVASFPPLSFGSEDTQLRDSPQPGDSRNSAQPSLSDLRRDMINLVEQISGSTKTWTASNHKFGFQRVNCITIWQPPKPPSDFPRRSVYTHPVAVLANNDKTVTVVNLYNGQAVDQLDLPDCVNRGVVSPDGSLLVAICDDPYLYIHVRCSLPGKIGNSFGWLPLPRIRLRDQSARDESDCRGSFAACFSPSGRFLAVGTQYGNIYVYNVAAFANPDQDPLITYFHSARAPDDAGAVRDMAFSPGPYDMLAWTEHRGRIGIADARSNFTRRQIISIEDFDQFQHVSLNDRNATIDPRLLDPRSEQNATPSPSLPNAQGPSASLPGGTEDADVSRFNQPFTAEEISILQAIQSERSRRERREREQREQQDSQVGRGNAGWRSSIFSERVSLPPRTPRDRHREIVERMGNLTPIQRETLSRVLDSQNRDQNRDQSRDQINDHVRNQPRRERSRENLTAEAPSSEQERERRAPTPRRSSSITQVLARQRLGTGEGPGLRYSGTLWGPLNGRSGSGWTDMEALYSMTNNEGTFEVNRQNINRLRRAIPIINDLWTDDASFGTRRVYGRMGHREHHQHPDDTAGLTWSEDGRTLYIGAENGIYEFRMNMTSRKLFPAVSLR